jgi:hypothetical protein
MDPMPGNFSAKLVNFLGNIIAGIALAIFITILILWSRSLHGTDNLELPCSDGTTVAFASTDGRFMFGRFEPDPGTFRWWGRPRHAALNDLLLDEDAHFVADLWGWGIALPHFVVAGMALIPMAWWFFVFRERREKSRWAAEGLCMVCGYDLRHSSGRCPECGTFHGVQEGGSVEHASPST